MKIWKLFFLLILSVFTTSGFALQCTIKVQKADCWANYNVMIGVRTNAGGGTRTAVLTKKTKKKEAVFEKTVVLPCKVGNRLIYSAKFNPPLWDDEKKDAIVAQNQAISVPQVTEKTTAVAMTICYPEDFKNAPFPYEYTPSCECKSSKVKEGGNKKANKAFFRK